jgi:hypothetical protein
MDVSPATKQAIAKANAEKAAKAAGAGGPQKNRTLLIGGIVGGVVLVGVIVAAIALRGGGPVPMNAPTSDMVKFVASDGYAKLPFDRQKDYMIALEGRDDEKELDKAFDDGKITESQYRSAMAEASLGQLLKRADKYAALSGAQKAKYVAELAEKAEKDDGKGKPKGDAGKPKPPHKNVKRDKALEDLRYASFPPDVRARVESFKAAFKQAREDYEAAHKKPSPKPAKQDQ